MLPADVEDVGSVPIFTTSFLDNKRVLFSFVKQALHFITPHGICEDKSPVMFQQLKFKASRNFLLEILWDWGRGVILPPKVVKKLHMLISKVSVKEKERFQQKFRAKKHYHLCVCPQVNLFNKKKTMSHLKRHILAFCCCCLFFLNSCPFLENQYILVNSLRQVRTTLEPCSL